MRREDFLIQCCARTNIDQELQSIVQGILSPDLDWAYFFERCQTEGLSSLIYKTLLEIDHIERIIPPDIWSSLRDVYYSAITKNIFIFRTLERISTCFEREGIEVMVFKGPMLAECVYGDIGLRSMGDIDILVKKEDMAKTHGILTDLGYSTSFGIDFSNPLFGLYRNTLLYQMTGSMSGSIHVHWHIINSLPYHERVIQMIDMDRIWRESIPIKLGGANLRTFSPYHQIIFLSMHILNHSFTPSILLCDIHEFLRLQKENVDWGRLVEEALEFGLSSHVYYTLYVVSTLLGTDIPEGVLNKLAPRRMSIFERKFISSVLEGRPVFTGEWLAYLGMNRTLRDKFLFLRRALFPSRNNLALIRQKGVAQVNFLDYLKRADSGLSCAIKFLSKYLT